MEVLIPLLIFGFVLFLGVMGNLFHKLAIFQDKRKFVFYCVGWYVAAAAILIDICYNRASCSLRIVLIGFFAPIVLWEVLRLLRRFVIWALKGLQRF